MPLIVSCAAALTSLSDSVSYITFLFSEWRISCSLVIVLVLVGLTKKRCGHHTILKIFSFKSRNEMYENIYHMALW